MSKSLLPNNFGISILADTCPKISIHHVIRQYRHKWEEQLAGTTVEIMATPVKLTHSKMSHSGKRVWFSCPQCNRRCGVLFEQPGSGIIGCRGCVGVKYRKSRYKGMVEERV